MFDIVVVIAALSVFFLALLVRPGEVARKLKLGTASDSWQRSIAILGLCWVLLFISTSRFNHFLIVPQKLKLILTVLMHIMGGLVLGIMLGLQAKKVNVKDY